MLRYIVFRVSENDGLLVGNPCNEGSSIFQYSEAEVPVHRDGQKGLCRGYSFRLLRKITRHVQSVHYLVSLLNCHSHSSAAMTVMVQVV